MPDIHINAYTHTNIKDIHFFLILGRDRFSVNNDFVSCETKIKGSFYIDVDYGHDTFVDL